MGVEVMDLDGPAQVSKIVDTYIEIRPLLALGVLVLLIGAYEMRKHVPKQSHSGSVVVHTADDLEIGRHKHDGSQPTADHARPGQHRTVTWDARL